MNQNLQNCQATVPFIIIIVVLFFTLIALGVWIFFLLRRSTPALVDQKEVVGFNNKSNLNNSQNEPPFYLYGFIPGVSSREIGGSAGVLTPFEGEIQLEPLSSINPSYHVWNILPIANETYILQHRESQNYIGNSNRNQLELVHTPEEAHRFLLIGPRRNGRVYHFKSLSSMETQYLAVAEDYSVGLMTVTGTLPLNTEWTITLGSCQAIGNNNC
jgi:hypothetical protein